MATLKRTPTGPSTTVKGALNNVLVRAQTVDPIVDELNKIIAGTYAVTNLVATTATVTTLNVTTENLTGVFTQGSTGQFTADASGNLITTGTAATGALTVTGAISASTTVTVGTNQSFAKEVDHTITVATTTTAATVGGKISIQGGTGATSGAGGAAELIGGTAGATAGATGGAVNITGGAQGAGNGITGAVNITTQNATGGAAGNILLTPGTSSSTTIAPVIIFGSNRITKPVGKTVAAGSLITGLMMVSGYIEVTGTTNSSAFDSAANITTALGSSPAGTTFDFYINTMGSVVMTAGNVLTVTAGANTQFMKQTSAGDSASAFLATVTATAGVHSAIFRVTYDTATTISIQRIG